MTGGEPLPAWFVVFSDRGAVTWWQKLLRPGFRHCWLFGWDEAAGRWLVVDPAFGGAYVRAADDRAAGLIWAELRQGRYTVLLARRGDAVIARPRMLLTCVSAVVAVLGVRACAFTPWGLYRHLLRQRAEVVQDGKLLQRAENRQ